MKLKIKDICSLLDVSEKTVYRWIKQNKIPVYKINHQYRFNQTEINEWIINNNMTVSEKILEIKTTDKDINIAELIENGGIYYHVEGDNINDVLQQSLKLINLPNEVCREQLYELLQEREDMLPTSIGKGIAFPHPKNNIITETNLESISVIFLENEIKYPSTDNIPLHTLFIILSANAKRHLEILSKLSYACQDNNFVKLLKNRATRGECISYISNKEQEWHKKMRA